MKPVEILLIEDNAGDILLMRQVLASEPFQISVRVAMDGQQALQMIARDFRPDLIILDLKLPQVSGLSFLEGCPAHVPVVVFTSSTNPEDRQRAFDLGVKEFVQKSSDLTEFAQQVSKIVRSVN